jgi:aminoglycoside phosphotransferase (APT) family kinase protein
MAEIEREHVRQRLEDWLAKARTDLPSGKLSALRYPAGTGNSAETSFAEFTYVADGIAQSKTYVFRRQLDQSDLFLNADLRLPYNMMRALSHYPLIPAAVTVGIEPDGSVIGSPFLVMEGVDGRVVNQVPNYNLEGWVADLSPGDRRTLWFNAIKTLAQLHKIDWHEHFQFLDDPKRGLAGLDQYLDWVKDWYVWARADRPMPVTDAALKYLLERKPKRTEVSVLWGDAAPANTMFKTDLSVAAMLDFEMAALGPGEVDLAWWLGGEEHFSSLVGIPRLEGLPTRAETIALYESERGRSVENMDYYFMLAYFRMATVIIRFIDRLIQNGKMPTDTDAVTNNPTTRLLAGLLGMKLAPASGEYSLMERGLAGASKT